jgi:DNA-binding transcriptional LysR family regulator
MELYQLKTIAAVAELGSLTQAAERLHVSQPAASAQIKAVENEFGVRFFERHPTGLRPTKAAATLLPEIKKLLHVADDVLLNARRLRGQLSGTVKVAIVSPTLADTSLLQLGAIMKAMVTQHPMLTIEVHNRNSRSVVAGITSREFDAGIALGNRPIPRARRIRLRELQYRIVAPGTWPARTRHATWSEIAKCPWVSAPKNGSHFQMATDLFRKHRFEPAKVIEADSEPIIASLVTAGVGLGLMREDLAKQAELNGAVWVLEKGRPRTYLELLHHSSREGDPAVQALVSVVKDIWRDKVVRPPAARSSGRGDTQLRRSSVQQAD